ncbi:MAG TPA: glycosyltransferase family 87 protein [Planktothrix sp.]
MASQSYGKTFTLPVGIGLVIAIGLLFSDLQIPALSMWTDFARLYYPCLHLAAAGQFGEIYKLLPGVVADASAIGRIYAAFVPPSETFFEMPCTIWLMRPLAHVELSYAQAIWHCCSFFALAFTVYLISRAAAVMELDAEAGDIGWACLTFAPIFMTLWLAQLGLVFGILPLAIGYYFLSHKKPLLAGLAWGFLIMKPAFLIVAAVNAIAQIMQKKFRCLVGLIASLGVFLYIAQTLPGSNVWLDNWQSFSTQPQLDPRLNISLAHTMLSFIAESNRAPWQQIVLFLGVFIAFGGFTQLKLLIEHEDKKHEIVPFATIMGCLLVPFMAPNLPFFDLSVLCFAGLVVHCIEWREHMEWRIQTLNRMYWLCINIYILVFYFAREFAHPAELLVLFLVFFMRLIEAIRFSAHTPNFE